MKYLLLLLILFSSIASAEVYLTVGHGFRAQSYRAAAGWLPFDLGNGRMGAEVGFSSMGEQPEGYNNINRMAEINIAAYIQFNDRLTGFGKVGANNTKWSHNGTNDYDRSGDSLWGWHVSIGLETPITENLFLQGQVATYEYRQVNNPNMGGYTYPSIGIRWRF
jgi:opacity protein-like surface antigen